MTGTAGRVGVRLLNVREAAEVLHASRAKVYRLLKSEDLPGYRVGKTYVFYESDLHAYVRRSQSRSGVPAGDRDADQWPAL